MYTNNFLMKDPILLRLEPATQSALTGANIHCLEDLLQLDIEEISDLNGIGKKRNLEILRLLYSLPFDFKQKPSPVNTSGDGLLGVNPDLKDYMLDLLHDRNDQTFKRGLAYYRENTVKSIELQQDDESRSDYVAYVKGSRQYKVRLLLDG